MKKYVYSVRACRWGHRETHSYIVGIYSTKTKAEEAADVEENWRGGNYICEIFEHVIDVGSEGRSYNYSKIIKRLPDVSILKKN